MPFTGIECWSESGLLECVAVFRPAALDVATSLEAAAVGFTGTVTYQETEEAFGRLKETLGRFCALVDLWDFLPSDERAVSNAAVNRVFVRDTAAVVGGQLVTGNAAFPARIAEFETTHVALSNLVRGPEQGAALPEIRAARVEFGDLFLLDSERLLINLGLRSDVRSLQTFLEVAWRAGFREVGVLCIPEHLGIIHLDLAFNVLGPQAVVARSFLRHFPIRVFQQGGAQRWEAFEAYFSARGRRVIPFEPVGPGGFMSNYIFLGPQLILASESAASQLRPIARDFGIEVESVDIEALERGNGSVRCLTLPLKRQAL
ncbi:arginine deiminase family protein [Hyalangium rubrum]|uniref:arginine deiminase n=1 Tax=Hyalangium rubrum TaxID=3103134 RepID=A0ABU5H8B9_9BACT|nr:arginine deiminase family protein [Hyalangium sp. s54d21]MDY7229486.1 arginine deiminase family protein [Hyalangium sp. s54d21]